MSQSIYLISSSNLPPSVPTSFPTNSGTAVPTANVLNVLGISGITVSGSGNTILISSDGTLSNSFVTNSGNAIPSGGVIDILTANTTVLFSGSGNTVTLDFNTPNANIILGCLPASISSADLNIGMGGSALLALTTGENNVALGVGSGQQITTGSNNTIVGYQAGGHLHTTNFNVIIGNFAGNNLSASTETSNIIISSVGVSGDSNTIRLGTQGTGNSQQNLCYIAGIVGNTVSNAQMVTINSSTGQLGIGTITGGTVTSVSGTANQVAVASGTTTPVISLIGPYTPATYTAHGVLIGEGTSSIVALGTGNAGQYLQSGGASADPAYSTATLPSTATGTGKILIADGTNWVASTPTYPSTAGTSGNVLTSNGTNWTSAAPATSGTVTSVSGTTNQVSVATGTTTPVISLVGPYTPATYTAHAVLVGEGTNSIVAVSPSATSGVPLISQGSSADPVFGTVVVAGGGTGLTTMPAYALVAGGTTTTGAFQSIADVATGSVLVSGGTAALPSFSAYPRVSGLGVGASAGSTAGITFDGTYFLNAYSNTSYTPVLAFGGSSTGITYSIQSGNYVKIGHVCYFNLEIVLTSKGSQTGNATVTLPFTSQSSDAIPVTFANVTLSGYSTNFDSFSGTFKVSNSAGAITVLTNSAFSNTSQIFISGCYQI